MVREINGKLHEPFETLTVEVPTEKVGPVMELTGYRRGTIEEMIPRGSYSLLRFSIPARGLIGLRTKLLNATQGTAIINHRFSAISRKKEMFLTALTVCWFPWSRVKQLALRCLGFKIALSCLLGR